MQRFEAFSDGVFAIAITLLVLEIHVPSSGDDLLPALARQWPSFAAYVASFVYIGVYWMTHNDRVSFVSRVDGGLRFLNVLFLMTIAFIPFPTAILAQRLESQHELNLATAFYGASMLLSIVVAVSLERYADRRGLIKPALSERWRAVTRRSFVGPALYTIAIPVSLVAPAAALAFYLAVPAYYGIESVRTGTAPEPG